MERKDLMRARHVMPELQNVWKDRRHHLENHLEIALNKLDDHHGKSEAAAMREAPALYREITRIDRSISFIDRAIVHLDDIERGTHYAQELPLAPASSPARRQAK